jgi:hypothetical protein
VAVAIFGKFFQNCSFFLFFFFSEKGIFNRVLFLVVNFCHFEKEYPVINSELFGEEKVIK